MGCGDRRRFQGNSDCRVRRSPNAVPCGADEDAMRPDRARIVDGKLVRQRPGQRSKMKQLPTWRSSRRRERNRLSVTGDSQGNTVIFDNTRNCVRFRTEFALRHISRALCPICPGYRRRMIEEKGAEIGRQLTKRPALSSGPFLRYRSLRD